MKPKTYKPRKDAILCFDVALDIDPKYDMAWCYRGLELGKLGRFEDAIKCFDEALKINPDYRRAWCKKALALGEFGRYREAIEFLDEVLKINPNDEEAIMLKKDFLHEVSK